MLKPKDIDNLAQLARLDIPEEEKESLRKEVDSILGYVGEIQRIAGTNQKSLKEGDILNVFRDDNNPHLSGEFTDDLIEAAPRRQGNYVKVKKIL